MVVRFDVRSLAPGDRPEAIRELSRTLNGCIEVDLPSNPSRIRAAAVTSVLGSVEISKIQWNVEKIQRTSRPMKDDVEPHVFMAFQEYGVSRFTQGGRTAEIGPGDLVVLENDKPYTVAFLRDVRTASVRVPTHVLGLPSSLLGQVTAVRRSQEPLVEAASAFFARMVRNQAALDATEADLSARPSIEMIRAIIATGLGREGLARESLHHTLLDRVLVYVRLHLAERDLHAPRIAAEHHVSVRQLYLTLSRAGISLGDWVRSERLRECKRDLASPAHRFMTIEAIACRWGFTSAPHFSRAFKTMYGMSPREWRQANAGKTGT
jgi:AraC-like DNA-binding protein